MGEFLIVYAALGLAAFGGNLVTDKQKEDRTFGIILLGLAFATGAVIAMSWGQ